MHRQTYQEVSRIIQADLLIFKELGFDNLNNLPGGYQLFYYNLKGKSSERYERLTFDTNGHKPYSGDLAEIVMDFRTCGIVGYPYKIMGKELTKRKSLQ